MLTHIQCNWVWFEHKKNINQGYISIITYDPERIHEIIFEISKLMAFIYSIIKKNK